MAQRCHTVANKTATLIAIPCEAESGRDLTSLPCGVSETFCVKGRRSRGTCHLAVIRYAPAPSFQGLDYEAGWYMARKPVNVRSHAQRTLRFNSMRVSRPPGFSATAL